LGQCRLRNDFLSQERKTHCGAGATLRFFVISSFTGDFAYRLNVAAADYAGSCACVHESTQVMMLSKKQ
jgi:hypothetical protein